MNDEKLADNSNSRSADFILQLNIILVGIGFGLSINTLVTEGIYLSTVARFLSVIIILANWLHGQVGLGLSETYDLGTNWLGRVLENYVEIAAVLILMTAALVQNNEIVFYWVVTLVYAFDFLLEVVYVRRLQNTNEKYEYELRLARSWRKNDIVALVTLVTLIIARTNWENLTETTASVSFFIAILLLTLWDYSENRDFYFGLPRKPEKQRMGKKIENYG